MYLPDNHGRQHLLPFFVVDEFGKAQKRIQHIRVNISNRHSPVGKIFGCTSGYWLLLSERYPRTSGSVGTKPQFLRDVFSLSLVPPFPLFGCPFWPLFRPAFLYRLCLNRPMLIDFFGHMNLIRSHINYWNLKNLPLGKRELIKKS
jgi:hypothetical protein